MFDASLPLVKELKEKVDLYCLYDVMAYSTNLMGITEIDFRGKKILNGTEFKSLIKYSDYLPLSKTHVISLTEPRNLIGNIKSARAIIKYVKDVAPDYIFFFNNPGINYLPLVYATEIPFSMAVHDPIMHSSQKSASVISIIRKLVFKKCNAFFLFSESLIGLFSETYKIPLEQIFKTALGPYNQLQLLVHPTLNTKSGKIKVLFFGRIQGYKGVKYLLEAFKRYQAAGGDKIELTILGKGFIEPDIIDLNNTPSLFIQNRFIPDDKLAQAISECDITICPYVDATQSGVIMSAYAFSKPVIATDVGGLAEMVEHEKYGLIIQPADADAIVSSFNRITENPDIVKVWSENITKDYYHGEKSWKSIADKLVQNIKRR